MGHFEPIIEKVYITPEIPTASQSFQLVISFSELERFLAVYAGEIYSGEALDNDD